MQRCRDRRQTRGRSGRRRDGTDPAHGADAAAKRGDANRQHQLANAAWNPDGRPTDPDYYRSEILPKISQLASAALVEATGLSRNYCAQILRGSRIPHPRHWATLENIPTDHRASE